MHPARARWRITAPPEPIRTGRYQDLAPLAQALGLPFGGAPEVSFRLNGQRAVIALEISSSQPVGVTMSLSLEGREGQPEGPTLKLTRETPGDRAGKAVGIARELDVGDALFDERVYIDSEATDEDTLRLLARPATRAAVMALLDTLCTVTLSQASVTAKWTSLEVLTDAEAALDALALLADAGGGGGTSGARAARRGAWLGRISGPAAVVLPAASLFASLAWPCGLEVPLVGALLGLIAGLWLRQVVARAVAGDSSSYNRYLGTVISLTVALMGLGAALPVALNGACDTAPSLVRRGVVVSAGQPDSDSESVSVLVRWENGVTEEDTLRWPVAAGAEVSREEHPGWLGLSWNERLQRVRR